MRSMDRYRLPAESRIFAESVAPVLLRVAQSGQQLRYTVCCRRSGLVRRYAMICPVTRCWLPIAVPVLKYDEKVELGAKFFSLFIDERGCQVADGHGQKLNPIGRLPM